MQELTPEGRRALDEIAGRHGVSADAALTLLRAVAAGGGTMAQFSHPELGGMGQWSAGGMVMVGDMFNYGLQQRVSALCSDLAGILRGPPVFAPQPQAGGMGGGGGQWWPAGLGAPAASGGQNDLRYAYFPASRRLAVQQGGQMRLYDTGDHQIGGVSQQQGSGQSLVFTSQYGPVRLSDLRSVDAGLNASGSTGVGSGDWGPADPPGAQVQEPNAWAPPTPQPPAPQAFSDEPMTPGESFLRQPYPEAGRAMPSEPIQPPPPAAGDPLALLERLAGLHQRGILSDEEFAAKKTELLRRL